MKNIVIAMLFLVANFLIGCASYGPFSPIPGMTIEEVSKTAYVPCDGYISPSKNNIVFIQKHPEAPSVDIYRTVADQKFKRGAAECRTDLYFENGVLISNEKLDELVFAYRQAAEEKRHQEIKIAEARRIEMENRQNQISNRQSNVDDGRAVIATLYQQNESYIQLWQNSLRSRCLGRYLNSEITGKEYFERKLPKINKDLKACYKENFKEELNDFAVRKYADTSLGGELQLIFGLASLGGSRLPNNFKELSSCHDLTRTIEIMNQSIIGITGYPQNGWCQKLK